MKRRYFLILFIMSMYSIATNAQENIDTAKIFVIIKNDGTRFVGKILSKDAREVLIDTKNMGQVIIPKHEIKEMRQTRKGEVNAKGDVKTDERFATRYFLTTNGLPIEKGESYMMWNLYGPDFQFAVADNFGMGIMTSWIGMPVIANAKYSIKLGENTNLGIGTLLGTGSWAAPDFGIALPFASFTYGNRRNNITFSAGYGAVWYNGRGGGRFLYSIAGMAKVSNKVSLIFDSFIMPSLNTNNDNFGLYIPALRVQTNTNSAFQFGLAGFSANGSGLVPIPFPFVQWFRVL